MSGYPHCSLPRKNSGDPWEISRKTGVRGILDLPATQTFKIAVDFNFD